MGDRAPEDTPGATQGLRVEPFRCRPHDRRPESAGHEDLERQEDPDAPFLQPPDCSERGVDLFLPDGEAPLSREAQGRPEGDAVSKQGRDSKAGLIGCFRTVEDLVLYLDLHGPTNWRSSSPILGRYRYRKRPGSCPWWKNRRRQT